MDPREEGATHPAMPPGIIGWERWFHKLEHSNQGKSQPSNSDSRETDNSDQTGPSRDAAAMAKAFEPLNRSLETFLTRLSRTSERSEKSKRVFQKLRCYTDESDGFKDTWIEVMKRHLRFINWYRRPVLTNHKFTPNWSQNKNHKLRCRAIQIDFYGSCCFKSK